MENLNRMKIAVAGAGYVGLSLAALLAQRHHVTAVDLLPERVDAINRREAPFQDRGLREFLSREELDLRAVTDGTAAYREADLVVIAVPTDYDSKKNFFDTSAVEAVLEQVFRCSDRAAAVIRSTVPVGYTEALRKRYSGRCILFSPEFLRESRALEDIRNPSRIIVGLDREDPVQRETARRFADLLREAAPAAAPQVLFLGTGEAEAVKLFANTYLALRVSFFNELDTYAETRGLDPGQIIRGVCLDPRIGDWYNNPSFGYGGCCLPKDTRQLLASCGDVPQNIMTAVVDSNRTRKEHTADRVLELAGGPGPVIGIYRLTMKSGSDNFRQSAVLDVMELLRERGAELLLYEPLLGDRREFGGAEVTGDLADFKARSRIILANRFDSCLEDAAEKVYTRDIYRRD